MLDVESKRFRVRANAATFSAEVTEKGGRTAFVPLDSVPSPHALAMMSESQFNAAMRRLIEEN